MQFLVHEQLIIQDIREVQVLERIPQQILQTIKEIPQSWGVPPTLHPGAEFRAIPCVQFTRGVDVPVPRTLEQIVNKPAENEQATLYVAAAAPLLALPVMRTGLPHHDDTHIDVLKEEEQEKKEELKKDEKMKNVEERKWEAEHREFWERIRFLSSFSRNMPSSTKKVTLSGH